MGRPGQGHGAPVTLLADILSWIVRHIVDIAAVYAVFALSVYLGVASSQLDKIAYALSRIADRLENPDSR